jgi:polyisoprenoid-binding protein YceI
MKTSEAKTKWVIDPRHSEIVFKVKHLMISYIKGEFRKFNGEIDGDDFTHLKLAWTLMHHQSSQTKIPGMNI